MVWANFCYFEGSWESENDLRDLVEIVPTVENKCIQKYSATLEGMDELIRMKRFSELR